MAFNTANAIITLVHPPLPKSTTSTSATTRTPFGPSSFPFKRSTCNRSPPPPPLTITTTASTTRCASSSVTKGRRKKEAKGGPDSEVDELVRVLARKVGEDKQPLLSTLNKYVRVVRTEHCFRLFEELGSKDRWLQCLEVFRWMQKQRWYTADSGIYSKLISLMGKKGQTRMAMWLFTEMRSSGCRPDTSVYNALITAHLHSRNKAKALAKASGYFEKMKGIERCQPNTVTYNILLRAYAQARDSQRVEILFKELEGSDFSPDIYTYNGVLDAYGTNGMINEMESLLVRMRSSQCRPNAITFNILINSYGKKQSFEKMEQVFKSFLHSKEELTPLTFNSMIINYGKARQREKAEAIFLKMKDLGYTPGQITYESLITTYGYCDCISKARAIFDEMMESGQVHASTFNVMLEAYCTNGLLGEAYELFDHACNKGIVPYSSTCKLLYRAFTKADAKELLERLTKHMDKLGIVPNKRFFLETLEEFGSSRSKSKTQIVKRNSTSLTKKKVPPSLQTTTEVTSAPQIPSTSNVD